MDSTTRRVDPDRIVSFDTRLLFDPGPPNGPLIKTRPILTVEVHPRPDAIVYLQYVARIDHRGSLICGRPMRSGRFCNMDFGHKGRCCSVAWECDGCGKKRRSHPSSTHPEAGWYCFMCADRRIVGDWWENAP